MKLKRNLKTFLSVNLERDPQKQLYKTYEIVGDIAIIRVPNQLEQQSIHFAKAIMNIHREIKSVWRQSSSVSGDFRLRSLQFLLGKKTTETLYKEYGCIYKTDLRKAYFSPRLSYERIRIAGLVKKGETVLNMFAGVGCYSIAIAKRSQPLNVISIDINPSAFQYLKENIRLNKAEAIVIGIQGDAKTLTEEKLQNIADRVIMPLPERAYEYLDYAVLGLKPVGGWIHYYDFEYAKKNEDPVKKVETKVSKKLCRLCPYFKITFGRIVRTIGPRWYQIVLDIQLKK